MSDPTPRPCTAFEAHRRIASGPLAEVALAVKAAIERDHAACILTFDDATGAVVDLDLRGEPSQIMARLAQMAAAPPPEPRGPGRPKLGVVAREVTLLPRHWEWLSAQPGGASQALRRLVDEARRGDGGQVQARAARDAAYRFMSAMAGNLPGFEEASRALFADDRDKFTLQAAGWPEDIRAHVERLAWSGSA